MTFTQIDDVLMDSPAFLSVSRSARLTLMEAYTYCNRHLTDGLINLTQWLRSTDSTDAVAEIESLVEAGIVTAVDGPAYLLDWSKQQTKEAVLKARERRRLDNERRAKSLELHRLDDHTLCTHDGGGRARGAKNVTSSTGPSNGPSTGRSAGRKQGKTSTGPSNGRSTGRSTGRSISTSSGRSVVGSPTHPIPTHNGVEGGMGWGPDGHNSAGAPLGLAPGAAESRQHVVPEPSRVMPGGFVVTAADMGGEDPNTLTQEEIENRMCDRALTDAD